MQTTNPNDMLAYHTLDIPSEKRPLVHRSTLWLGIVLACLIPITAIAQQPPTQTFQVTVTGPSQQQSQTLGASAIATAIMQLHSLQRYNHYTRQAERQGTASPSVTAIGAPGFGAALLAAAVASSDLAADFARWNGFVSVDYRFGEQDNTADVPAFDFKRYGLLVGADYRVNPDLVVGASLGYQSYKNDFTSIDGHAEMDGWSVSGFGSWYPMKSWYLEGIVRVGINEYETERPLSPNGSASGSTDGVGYSTSIGTGYVFNHNAWTVTPTFRVTHSQANIDGYRELSSTGTGGLTYQEQEVRSLTSNLGGNATYAINTNYGVLLPQVTFEWVHQFEDDPSTITAAAAASSTTTFLIPINAKDENYYRAAIGGTAILPHGRILYVYYEAVLSLRHKDIHTLTLGGRIEF